MRLARTPPPQPHLPLWPPLLATRGQGGKSAGHAHHAMHLVLALQGSLEIVVDGVARRGAGVLTAPDVAHALDARGVEILLVFVEPESEVGASLRRALGERVRIISARERAALDADVDPIAIMGPRGVAWSAHVTSVLGSSAVPAARPIHPRVKKLLALLRRDPTARSLESLAQDVGLSPSRLMHVFTESIGVPLRPYLAWLRLQRAASAIVSGASLTDAAATAGFADSAHMSRSFRRTFGMTPSSLRPPQPVRSSVAGGGALGSRHGNRT